MRTERHGRANGAAHRGPACEGQAGGETSMRRICRRDAAWSDIFKCESTPANQRS
ncbi:hypothetical protein OH687_24965 [Burkholderia anthina]|nr:hypothetical protein OH687_24965 [Burkholderia anthina]